MAVAPAKAAVGVSGEERSAVMISTPSEDQWSADGEVGVRVRPRIFQSGRVEKNAATEPPWDFQLVD